MSKPLYWIEQSRSGHKRLRTQGSYRGLLKPVTVLLREAFLVVGVTVHALASLWPFAVVLVILHLYYSGANP